MKDLPFFNLLRSCSVSYQLTVHKTNRKGEQTIKHYFFKIHFAH